MSASTVAMTAAMVRCIASSSGAIGIRSNSVMSVDPFGVTNAAASASSMDLTNALALEKGSLLGNESHSLWGGRRGQDGWRRWEAFVGLERVGG